MPSVTVTIAGNDVSTDFVSLSTEQDICSLAQTCEIDLNATSGSHAYNPWDTLVIAINGTNRLTGYVEDATKHRGNYVIRGMDEMKRAIDTFITDETRVTEELDAGYWIDYWLTQVGITTSGSIATGRDIPPTLPDEEGWIYINVGNIILECLAYAGGGYVVIIDGDGVAQIREKTIGASGHTLNCIEFSRSQDNSWYRDRAVVFGTTSGSWDEGVWIPGEVTIVAEAPDSPPAYPNTAVLSSSYIQTQAAADDLANDILNFFDEYLDVKRCLIEGDESVWLGDSASVDEFGYSGTGLVTSIETTVDDNGFRQLVSLDEKCGFVWGWGWWGDIFALDTFDIWKGLVSSGSRWEAIHGGFPDSTYYSSGVAIEYHDETLWSAIGYFSGDPKGLWYRSQPQKGTTSWQEVTTLPDPPDSDGLGLTNDDLLSRDLIVNDNGTYFLRSYETGVERGWLYTNTGSWQASQIYQDNFGYCIEPRIHTGLAVSSSGSAFMLGMVRRPGCMEFSGNGYVQVPYHTSMNFTPRFWLTWWMKSAEANQTCVLFGRPNIFEVGLDAGDVYLKVWHQGGGTSTTTSIVGNPPPTDSWKAYQVSIASGTAITWVSLSVDDGWAIGFPGVGLTYDPLATGVDLYIGCSSGNNSFYKGRLDMIQCIDGSVNQGPLLNPLWISDPFMEDELWPSQVFSFSFDEEVDSITYDEKGPSQLQGTLHGDAQFNDDYVQNYRGRDYRGLPKQTVLRKDPTQFTRVGLWLWSQHYNIRGIAIDDDDNLYAYGNFRGAEIKKTFDYTTWITWGDFTGETSVQFLLPTSGSAGVNLYAFVWPYEVWYRPWGGSWTQKTDLPSITLGGGITVDNEYLIMTLWNGTKSICKTIDGADTWTLLDTNNDLGYTLDVCVMED